jgi:TRAP-type C4-dicarboxylate transport system permease small subunit
MKLEKLINSVIPILCAVLLALMVSLTFLQIVLRQFFSFTMNWSDEVAQICMMWFIFLGAIWCTKNNQQLNTGFKLHQKLNTKQVLLIDASLELLIAFCLAVVTYHTAVYAFSVMGAQSTSLPWLKIGYIHLVQPFAMLILCYLYLKSLFKNVWRIFMKGSDFIHQG